MAHPITSWVMWMHSLHNNHKTWETEQRIAGNLDFILLMVLNYAFNVTEIENDCKFHILHNSNTKQWIHILQIQAVTDLRKSHLCAFLPFQNVQIINSKCLNQSQQDGKSQWTPTSSNGLWKCGLHFVAITVQINKVLIKRKVHCWQNQSINFVWKAFLHIQSVEEEIRYRKQTRVSNV